jgi:hypothetical protein
MLAAGLPFGPHVSAAASASTRQWPRTKHIIPGQNRSCRLSSSTGSTMTPRPRPPGWGPDRIGDRTDIPNWMDWFRSPTTPNDPAAQP